MLKAGQTLVVLCASLVLISCAQLQGRSGSPEISEKATLAKAEKSRSKYSPLDDGFSSKEFGKIELVVNKDVLKWMAYYQGRGRKHMNRYLGRSTRYMGLMKKVLKDEGLPSNLVYLPIIESGFSSHAHSHASAVGYWQFIRGTGKRYGLRIDNFVDERRDPVASTHAAAAYLKALYNLFGDWYLALASYNTGENRIKRVVMRYKTRDYWKLAKGRRIPRETRSYVPKFLAAMIIARNPAEYGFKSIDYQPSLSYDSVVVKKSMSLDKLAKNLGVKYDDIKVLNPKFRSDYVPVNVGGSESIRVPVGMQIQAIAAVPKSYSDAPKIIPNDYFWYRVRRGDTLSGIAYKNRTTIGTIRRINGLGRRSFIRAGKRLKLPDRGQYLKKIGRSKKRVRKYVSSGPGTFHTVRRGENLSLIANRYGTSVSQLRRLNRLGRRSLIRAGQKIKVKEQASSPRKPSSSVTKRPQHHVVKRGENLYSIAKKYNLGMQQLVSWNRLDRKSVLFVGKRLRLSEPRSSRVAKTTTQKRSPANVHVVKSGENLTLIARKYGIPVHVLAKKNDIRKRSVLFVGKRLRIPETSVQ